MNQRQAITRKPPWLKKRIPAGQAYQDVFRLLESCRLHTVCEEAHCPNLGECFSSGTATFMIMGDRCTRNCAFCAVGHGAPLPLDGEEPDRVARAVKALGLRYAVVTSVTRDDLPDGGAAHFAATLGAVKEQSPGTRVEVLIPDLQGQESALREVLAAGPDVLNHNLETVPRLYPEVRPQAIYGRSLTLLRRAAAAAPHIPTKSGLMLGLGEEGSEVRAVLADLLEAGCGMLTLGQYLAPSRDHHPVVRYLPPDEFERWKEVAREMGFRAVASGPFVRSSYHAGDMFLEGEGV